MVDSVFRLLFYHQKNRKDGLTVFTKLNTGGERIKKINFLAFILRRQFPIITLFSVAYPVYKK